MNDLTAILKRYRKGLNRLGIVAALFALMFSTVNEQAIVSVGEALSKTTYIARQDGRARQAGGTTFTELWRMAPHLLGEEPSTDFTRILRESHEALAERCREQRPAPAATNSSDEVYGPGIWGDPPQVRPCEQQMSGVERAVSQVSDMHGAQYEAVRDIKIVVLYTLAAPTALILTLLFGLWLATPFFRRPSE